MLDHRYQEVWAVDFEFTAPDGHRADPICMVAKELLSGRVIRLAREELHRLDSAPFNTGPDTLFLAFYASAEFGCFIALGWPLPINVIDLHAEFRNMTNGLAPPHGNNLLGALLAFGLPPGDAVEKREMRELAKRGAPFTAAEMRALIDYCGHDVQALAQLWPVMEPHLDKSALLRGAYMKAAASIEWTGVPIDRATLTAFGDRWSDLKLHIASVLDPSGEVWEGYQIQAGPVSPMASEEGDLVAPTAFWSVMPEEGNLGGYGGVPPRGKAPCNTPRHARAAASERPGRGP